MKRAGRETRYFFFIWPNPQRTISQYVKGKTEGTNKLQIPHLIMIISICDK